MDNHVTINSKSNVHKRPSKITSLVNKFENIKPDDKQQDKQHAHKDSRNTGAFNGDGKRYKAGSDCFYNPKYSQVLKSSHTPTVHNLHTPAVQSSHTAGLQKSHKPVVQNSHTPKVHNSHTPAVQSWHTPAVHNSHTPAVLNSHTPAVQKSHRLARGKQHVHTSDSRQSTSISAPEHNPVFASSFKIETDPRSLTPRDGTVQMNKGKPDTARYESTDKSQPSNKDVTDFGNSSNRSQIIQGVRNNETPLTNFNVSRSKSEGSNLNVVNGLTDRSRPHVMAVSKNNGYSNNNNSDTTGSMDRASKYAKEHPAVFGSVYKSDQKKQKPEGKESSKHASSNKPFQNDFTSSVATGSSVYNNAAPSLNKYPFSGKYKDPFMIKSPKKIKSDNLVKDEVVRTSSHKTESSKGVRNGDDKFRRRYDTSRHEALLSETKSLKNNTERLINKPKYKHNDLKSAKSVSEIRELFSPGKETSGKANTANTFNSNNITRLPLNRGKFNSGMHKSQSFSTENIISTGQTQNKQHNVLLRNGNDSNHNSQHSKLIQQNEANPLRNATTSLTAVEMNEDVYIHHTSNKSQEDIHFQYHATHSDGDYSKLNRTQHSHRNNLSRQEVGLTESSDDVFHNEAQERSGNNYNIANFSDDIHSNYNSHYNEHIHESKRLLLEKTSIHSRQLRETEKCQSLTDLTDQIYNHRPRKSSFGSVNSLPIIRNESQLFDIDAQSVNSECLFTISESLQQSVRTMQNMHEDMNKSFEMLAHTKSKSLECCHMQEMTYHRLFRCIVKAITNMNGQPWKLLLRELLDAYPAWFVRNKQKMIEQFQTDTNEKVHDCLILWKEINQCDGDKDKIKALRHATQKVCKSDNVQQEMDAILDVESQSSKFIDALTEPMLNKLALEIGHEWISLALCLGHSHKYTEQLQINYSHNVGAAILQMLVDWKNRQNANVDILVKALVTVDRNDLVETLRPIYRIF